MTSFDEKIQELQSEIKKLDASILSPYTFYIFITAIIAPYAIYTLLYIILYNTQRTNIQNKKRALKYTIIISIASWISLYGADWYLKKN